jgi:hypothetical protein
MLTLKCAARNYMTISSFVLCCINVVIMIFSVVRWDFADIAQGVVWTFVCGALCVRTILWTREFYEDYLAKMRKRNRVSRAPRDPLEPCKKSAMHSPARHTCAKDPVPHEHIRDLISLGEPRDLFQR